MPNSTNKLLPSLAFVSCLVDSSQSIYDVLCSLSKYALWKTQSLVFTREQARQRVNDFYGFELPQALITRVLKILVTRSLCTRSSQKYALSANDNGLYEQMDSDFDTTTSTHNELIISIQAFIKKNNLIPDCNQETLRSSLLSFINNTTKENGNEDYYTAIELFLLENEPASINNINPIKRTNHIPRDVCNPQYRTHVNIP